MATAAIKLNIARELLFIPSSKLAICLHDAKPVLR
jgi:hypothetical protein